MLYFFVKYHNYMILWYFSRSTTVKVLCLIVLIACLNSFLILLMTFNSVAVLVLRLDFIIFLMVPSKAHLKDTIFHIEKSAIQQVSV